uniref:Uncharacterized protein n=1 Tax=Chromera velia CCMP2878 TaxID=1169474 RepID=A0A0G4FWP8_9ALVE|eukprot:Cvel_19032.t1-p1 / transcript=Cvel_19032.t1 / gene=Cvel_19032 / organism=Chromera_velia_CCMP2878 / gene_product=Ankyrin repeat domain-containing protein 50, putative / transcript_product=Ankyrin repeat domain-containing protein 50, putative / location=Cvel_scaffold1612:14720-20609(+) / protein_length=512 / sequence_SO=supercontig / SO=protein_coding / is_pseudo=false
MGLLDPNATWHEGFAHQLAVSAFECIQDIESARPDFKTLVKRIRKMVNETDSHPDPEVRPHTHISPAVLPDELQRAKQVAHQFHIKQQQQKQAAAASHSPPPVAGQRRQQEGVSSSREAACSPAGYGHHHQQQQQQQQPGAMGAAPVQVHQQTAHTHEGGQIDHPHLNAHADAAPAAVYRSHTPDVYGGGRTESPDEKSPQRCEHRMSLNESELDSAGGVRNGKEIEETSGEGVDNGGLPCLSSSSSSLPSPKAAAALQVESEKKKRQWKDLPKGVWAHIRRFRPVDPDQIRKYALEASRTGGQEAIKEFHNLMLLGADPNASVKGDPLLHFVLRQVEADPSTSSALVKLLIKCGASPLQPNKICGRTPLYAAALEGRDAVVSILVAAGADKDKADRSGETPLYVAAFGGHDAVVSMLVSAGADKDKAANSGETPLFIAAQRGHGTVASILLEAGADKDKATNTGQTPLYAAASRGHRAVMSILVSAGVDKDKAEEYGQTPLYAAARYGPDI